MSIRDHDHHSDIADKMNAESHTVADSVDLSLSTIPHTQAIWLDVQSLDGDACLQLFGL